MGNKYQLDRYGWETNKAPSRQLGANLVITFRQVNQSWPSKRKVKEGKAFEQPVQSQISNTVIKFIAQEECEEEPTGSQWFAPIHSLTTRKLAHSSMPAIRMLCSDAYIIYDNSTVR